MNTNGALFSTLEDCRAQVLLPRDLGVFLWARYPCREMWAGAGWQPPRSRIVHLPLLLFCSRAKGRVIHKSVSLKYEPFSEPLQVSGENPRSSTYGRLFYSKEICTAQKRTRPCKPQPIVILKYFDNFGNICPQNGSKNEVTARSSRPSRTAAPRSCHSSSLSLSSLELSETQVCEL